MRVDEVATPFHAPSFRNSMYRLDVGESTAGYAPDDAFSSSSSSSSSSFFSSFPFFFFFSLFFFFFLLLPRLYGTPCVHTKVQRDARNGRRKLLRSGSLFDRGTEFRPGAWPVGKCVRDPRWRFPVGNGREDRFSPFNDLSP